MYCITLPHNAMLASHVELNSVKYLFYSGDTGPAGATGATGKTTFLLTKRGGRIPARDFA